jgi:hypothetical protein
MAEKFITIMYVVAKKKSLKIIEDCSRGKILFRGKVHLYSKNVLSPRK